MGEHGVELGRNEMNRSRGRGAIDNESSDGWV